MYHSFLSYTIRDNTIELECSIVDLGEVLLLFSSLSTPLRFFGRLDMSSKGGSLRLSFAAHLGNIAAPVVLEGYAVDALSVLPSFGNSAIGAALLLHRSHWGHRSQHASLSLRFAAVIGNIAAAVDDTSR